MFDICDHTSHSHNRLGGVNIKSHNRDSTSSLTYFSSTDKHFVKKILFELTASGVIDQDEPHSASKIHVIDMIFRLTLMHLSMID